jgi:hypothetical protein
MVKENIKCGSIILQGLFEQLCFVIHIREIAATTFVETTTCIFVSHKVM